VEIKFSRHARRRGQLYGISERTVSGLMKDLALSHGKHEIIKAVRGFKYPLKIVVYVESGTVTVITNYPVRKGRKNEGIL
jgi:hypothetical protein